MVRTEEGDYVRRILEALLNELAARKLLENGTVQNVVNEGKA
jgi:hypothetical protein